MKAKIISTIRAIAQSKYVFRVIRIICVALHIPRKIVVFIDGGMANQMWQFALAYTAHRNSGLPIQLDLSWYKQGGKDDLGNPNRLFLLTEIFEKVQNHITLPHIKCHSILDKLFILVFGDGDGKRTSFDYDPSALSPHFSKYYIEYREGYRWVDRYREELSEIFDFTPILSSYESEICRLINDSCSVALHIRKGDFVGSLSFDVCSDSYYLRAIKHMLDLHPEAHFFVFSNDENYAEQLMRCSGVAYTLLKQRSEERPQVDFYLMKRCKHAIISNSGFSFLPAYLTYSTSKDVILPEYWKNDYRKDQSRYAFAMQGWIRLPIEV